MILQGCLFNHSLFCIFLGHVTVEFKTVQVIEYYFNNMYLETPKFLCSESINTMKELKCLFP